MLVNLWDRAKVDALSHLSCIEGLVSIGTVLAVTLKVPPAISYAFGKRDGTVQTEGEKGYGSGASVDVVMALRERGIYTRPLGNVVYIMVAPNTPRETCDWLIQTLVDVIVKSTSREQTDISVSP